MSYTTKTTENTSEMPMNNQPTLEPNQYYYAVKYINDRRYVFVVKVIKSVWLQNSKSYYIIKNDEKGKYIKVFKNNYYAINKVYSNNHNNCRRNKTNGQRLYVPNLRNGGRI